jgi:hypothetical protein
MRLLDLLETFETVNAMPVYVDDDHSGSFACRAAQIRSGLFVCHLLQRR